MNWLVVIIFIIFFINLYQGYKKGFLRTALSLVSWIFIIVIANMFAPQLAQMLISQTSIDETIIQFINERLIETVDVIGIAEQLPVVLRELLFENSNSFEGILISDILKTEELLLPYIFKILHILCMIILTIALRCAVIIVDKILAFATNLPLIGQADKTLGLFLGIVKGLVLVWILMSIITIGFMLNINSFDIAIINESQILRLLYENNPFLNVIL